MKTKTTKLSLYREDPDNVSTATDAEIARLAGKVRRNPRGLAAMRIAYITDAPGGGRMVNTGNKRLRVLKQIAADGGLAVDGAWLISPAGDVPAEWFCDITFMTPEQRREFRLNTNISDGSFDAEKLLAQYDPGELAELMSADALQEILDAAETDEAKDGKTDADAVPSAPETPVSKRGEVYICGEHRLMCGDSTDADAVAKLMNGERADLVFTDPPYGMKYTRHIPKDEQRFDMLKNDDTILDFFPCVQQFSDGFVFVCTTFKVLNQWLPLFCKYLDLSNMIIWYKGGGGLGDLRTTFAVDYEVILVSSRKHEIFGKRIGSVWECGRDNGSDYDHPTQKPVALSGMAIDHTTKDGGIVLDLFGGSGSTMIACEQLGRKCRMMELDPHYCDVIRKRWAEFVHGEGCDWQALTPKTK